MKEIKLFGIGNENDFSYYVFERNENFNEVIKTLFILFNIHQSPEEEEDMLRIFNNPDKHYSYVKNEFRIDFFTGERKIFLIIHSDFKLRKTFNLELEKITIM